MSESQKLIDLIHRLAGSEKAIVAASRPRLRAQGIKTGDRAKEVKAPTGKSREKAVEKIITRKTLTVPEVLFAQSIVADLRPAIAVENDDYGVVEEPFWNSLNDDAIRSRLGTAIRATCRIENKVDGKHMQVGTGFLVDRDLVMTNRHVASAFVVGVGTAPSHVWASPAADLPRVNFRREGGRPDGAEEASIEITGPVMMHPYFDLALLRLRHPATGVTPLELAAQPLAAQSRANVAVIGYPAVDDDDPDPPASVMTRPFGVKRVQPGKLGANGTIRSYDKQVVSRGHDSSTLPGSSGSPVIDLDTGKVVALHFYGKVRNSNWAVRASDLACDPRIIDAGVRFDAPGDTSTGPWDQWWTLANMNAVAAGTFGGEESLPTPRKKTVTVTFPVTFKLDLKTGKASVKGKSP